MTYVILFAILVLGLPLQSAPSLPMLFVSACADSCYEARAGTYAMRVGRQGVFIASHGGLLRLDYLAAQPGPPVARQPGEAVVHDYRGSDPAAWRSNLPTWREVGYDGLYPGISVRFSSTGDRLKSEYTLQPGAAPGLIRFRFEGADSVALDGAGRLVVNTAGGAWTEDAPVAWQDTATGRRPVPVSFHLEGPVVSFSLGAYDPALPLVIDPTVSFSTLFGGSGNSVAQAVLPIAPAMSMPAATRTTPAFRISAVRRLAPAAWMPSS